MEYWRKRLLQANKTQDLHHFISPTIEYTVYVLA